MSAPHPVQSRTLIARARILWWIEVWGLAVNRYNLRAELLSCAVAKLEAIERSNTAGRRRLEALARLADLDGWPRQARMLRRAAAAPWGESRND
jgi:hypothetical protein